MFVDNLLDLSHLAFTHKSSIGSSSSAVAEPDMEVSVEGDVVRGRRYIYNVEPGPLIVKWGGFAGQIDRCSDYVWRPPSVVEIESKFSDPTNKITIMVINPITPETDVTAHFWIGWSRDFDLDDEEVIPEPEIWFHDILRRDGKPYNVEETNFIKEITSSKKLDW